MRNYEVLINALKAMSNTNSCFYCQCEPLVCEANGCTLSNAADAIEELLDKVPHWISVEERMPDHGKRVLAIYANGVISTGRVFRNGFPEAYDGLDENGDFKAVPVTHWMPLPAPPKGVE